MMSSQSALQNRPASKWQADSKSETALLLEDVSNKNQHEILVQARKMLPNLVGTIGMPDEAMLQFSASPQQGLHDIYALWQQQYSDAGHAYWWVRTWSILYWQPIYLSVASVHLSHTLVDFKHFFQKPFNGYIAGFRLSPLAQKKPLTDVAVERLIQQAAFLLKPYIEDMWQAFADMAAEKQLGSVKHKLGMRLVADAVLIALQRVFEIKKPPVNTLIAYSREWLKHLALQGESHLVEIPTAHTSEEKSPCLDRKACCMYFRISQGELCDTCPKLSWDERVTRHQNRMTLNA